MANLEEFGYIVRDAREARGMNQATLGRMVGLSRASISLLERGEIKYPRIALIEKLASNGKALSRPPLTSNVGRSASTTTTYSGTAANPPRWLGWYTSRAFKASIRLVCRALPRGCGSAYGLQLHGPQPERW